MKAKRKRGTLIFYFFIFFSLHGLCCAETFNHNDRSSDSLGLRWSVKLYGGMSYLSVGDINAGLEGWIDYWRNSTGGTVKGEFETFHRGFEGGGECIAMLNSRIGMGLGIGYLNAGKKSTVTGTIITLPIIVSEHTVKPKVNAIPLTMSIYYYLPVKKGINLITRVGLGYYLGKFNWQYNIHSINVYRRYEENWKGKTGALGILGGLGFEVHVLSNVYLLFEGEARSVQLKGFKGDYIWRADGEGYHYSDVDQGAMFWYYEYSVAGLGKKFPRFMFDDERPTQSFYQKNVREGKVDLSGFSFRIGIRVKIL